MMKYVCMYFRLLEPIMVDEYMKMKKKCLLWLLTRDVFDLSPLRHQWHNNQSRDIC